MKNIIRFKSLVLSVVFVFAVSTLFTACGSNSSGTSGSIIASGSTALQPLAEKAAGQFTAKSPGSQVGVQGGGSGTGLAQVAEGSVAIGNSDIFAAEKLDNASAKELIDHKVCVVGFATIVNPNVKVDSLTQQQLIDIFSGKITNWKDVGGGNTNIVIINRPKSSGTRTTFKKYALNGVDEAVGTALTQDSSGAVKKIVAETEGAIAYLSLSNIDNSIKTLKFNNVEATPENITSGKYQIWSYEHMYTKGEPAGVAKAFIDYMLSDEVQKGLVPEMKFIPINDMTVSR